MGRLTRLDGLRGMLAVYVMIGHAMPFAVLPRRARLPFSHGEAAVDLFFALSGLVIVNSLEHFQGRLWPFLRARGWRLLPVYFVVLALATVLLELGSPLTVMPWIGHSQAALQTWAMVPPRPLWPHVVAHLALLQGLIPQGILPYAWISLLGPAWSLSTEWQFYGVIALALPRINSPHRLLIFTLGMLAVGVIYHAVAGKLPPYWQFSRSFLPDAAAFFALGLASAVWLRGGGLGLLLLCAAVTAALGGLSAAPFRALIPAGWLLALLVQRRPHFPALGPLLDSRMAQYLGAISYPLYLLNEPIQRCLALLIAPHTSNQTLFSDIWLPLAISMPVAAAMLLHHCIEKPFMKGWKWRREGGARKGLASGSF